MKLHLILGWIILVPLSSSGEAQAYLIVNEDGKPIFVPPGTKDPDRLIIDRMRSRPSKSWRVEMRIQEKGCFEIRSVSFHKEPTEHVVGRGDTLQEAARNARDLAQAKLVGRKNRITDSYAGGGCNKVIMPLRQFDLGSLSRRAAEDEAAKKPR